MCMESDSLRFWRGAGKLASDGGVWRPPSVVCEPPAEMPESERSRKAPFGRGCSRSDEVEFRSMEMVGVTMTEEGLLAPLSTLSSDDSEPPTMASDDPRIGMATGMAALADEPRGGMMTGGGMDGRCCWTGAFCGEDVLRGGGWTIGARWVAGAGAGAGAGASARRGAACAIGAEGVGDPWETAIELGLGFCSVGVGSMFAIEKRFLSEDMNPRFSGRGVELAWVLLREGVRSEGGRGPV